MYEPPQAASLQETGCESTDHCPHPFKPERRRLRILFDVTGRALLID